ncbi:pyrroline-5-carboxylate reductase [Salinithrix halophila]|uniref:Pyrroline-5-carboxylate reductase n=1 Tax=Salinithrix halophila TaxID=1485204 RepID=A0ABV8JL32_9BACL
MKQRKHYCFIGAGSMAEAILGGLTKSRRADANGIHVINRCDRDRLTQLKNHYSIQCPEEKEKAVTRAETIILAVKPKDMADALDQWGGLIRPGQRVISVAAGISTAFIEERIASGVAVIRAMPNTSSMIGRSATAICGGRHAAKSDLEEAVADFSSIGSTVIVDEKDMDTVTGLSGSGPAYIYYFVEALEQAGVREGLSHQVARQLTLQTLVGAAHMLLETGEDPAELRRKVTSPGGTTMAAIETLADHHFHQALQSAVHRARKRSEELGQVFTPSAAK